MTGSLLNRKLIVRVVRTPVTISRESVGRWAIVDADNRMIAVTRADNGRKIAQLIANALNEYRGK